MKETVESILVAFILAFIFRAFVVEAFVIPTGSMAPTLLGAHMRFHCHDCGYAFTTNFGAASGSDDLNIPAVAPGPYTVYCPNCGFRVPQKESTRVPVHYGDRILVLKYAYLLSEPKPWDVVVFKSPDPVPGSDLYTTNYIKRLVGRPGESILILDGDVYVGQSDAQLITDFEIQTKPRHAQAALWRVVYDNDYHPLGLPRSTGGRWQQPWKLVEGEGWDLGQEKVDSSTTPAASTGRDFRFDNASGAATIAFDRRANPENHALTDWLAYDREGSNAAVSDLKLDCYYTRTSGDGALRLMLSKYDDQFIAEITPTQARVFRQKNNGDKTPLGEAVDLPARAGKPIHVEFENLDYRITLRIDGQEVFQSTPMQYRPDPARLLERFNQREAAPFPTISIQAERQTCELSHLGLWRDVYYINGGGAGARALWAGPSSFPDHVMRLGDDEFFVLGDNSLISGDARMWTQTIDLPHEDLHVASGRVPERFMLGKAFFVYWPAGYKPADFSPAIVPNFGEMRFIH